MKRARGWEGVEEKKGSWIYMVEYMNALFKSISFRIDTPRLLTDGSSGWSSDTRNNNDGSRHFHQHENGSGEKSHGWSTELDVLWRAEKMFYRIGYWDENDDRTLETRRNQDCWGSRKCVTLYALANIKPGTSTALLFSRIWLYECISSLHLKSDSPNKLISFSIHVCGIKVNIIQISGLNDDFGEQATPRMNVAHVVHYPSHHSPVATISKPENEQS